MKHGYAIVLFACWYILYSAVLTSAQPVGNQPGSLKEKPAYTKGDSLKLSLLDTLLYKGDKTYDMAGSISIYDSAASLAKKWGYKAKEGTAHVGIAQVFERNAEYIKALAHYQEAMRLYADPDDIKSTLGNMGSIYISLGDYSKSLECFEQSYNIQHSQLTAGKNRTQNDSLTLMVLLSKIADIHILMGQYDKALGNYRHIASLNLNIRNPRLVLEYLKGIGNCLELKNEPAAAIDYFKQALQKSRELKGHPEEAAILNELGGLYLDKGEINSALQFAQDALDISHQDAKNKPETNAIYLPDTYVLLGKIYTRKKQLTTAAGYLQQAIYLYQKTGRQGDESYAWHTISDIYIVMNDPARAFDAYKRYTTLRDSIFNFEKAREITRTEMNGEFTRKQMGDSLVQARKDLASAQRLRNQQTLTYIGFAGIIIVLLLSFFIYRSYAIQKKANAAIKVQKELAEVQRQRAERSEHFKQMFLANMSHEIRTPVNAINGMTDLLLEKTNDAGQREYLQVISGSSNILLHLVNDILDLSKIEAGKLVLEKIDFSLTAAIRQVKETLSLLAGEKGLLINTDIPGNIPDVLSGDPYRLGQVLLNLGSNAVKFTERGSVTIGVACLQHENDIVSLRFSVTDTGIGIQPGKIKTLFENFSQVNDSDSRKYGGTGLGLSISKQLVALQGGQMNVESVYGQGSCFSFTLDYTEGSAAGLQERLMAEQKPMGAVLNGLRILLADDSEYNIMVARETLLNRADVSIDVARNGREAISLLQQNDYDVVLMDIQMPVMNGIDACRYIRDELPEPLNKIPVIGFTASLLRSDTEKYAAAGMNTYIPKPFKAWQLFGAIAEVTGRKAETAAPSLPGMPVAVTTVTDRSYLRKFCENDEERMKEYIRMFLKTLPAFHEKIAVALREKDIAQIAAAIHNIKPRLMMMGMKKALELAETIAQLCIEENELVFEHINRLTEQTERSVTELEPVS